jgi:hypothetical protein
MLSPFPGMDPYLEGELWSNFHTQLAVQITHQLNPRLKPRYVAVTEKYQNTVGPEEIGIETGGEFVNPDVGVSQTSTKRLPRRRLQTARAPLLLDTVISVPVHHVWVKILDVKRRLLVTAIEFLSPVNKQGGGRRKYLKKRRKLLLSRSHFIEIDLLRQGKRVPMAEPLPAAPYFVFLSRVEKRPKLEVWPITLDQALPRIPVPLLKEDNEVDLDLQTAFERVYEFGSMEQLIDYANGPDVSLPPDLAKWADGLLTAAGKRG